MIQAAGLRKEFGDFVAVKDVSFSVPAGQICGYLGANGAGKSTTVKMLTGLITPTSGRATVAGYDVATHPLEAKLKLGYIPETGAVYESLTPIEYLRFVGRLYHINEKLLAEKIEDFLTLWGLIDHRNDRMSGFSKGMKQKVVISSALMHDPDVVFFDEPLNGIDANAALLLKELMSRLAASGKALMYTSHILDVVERVCDRVIILHKGEIIADGTMDQLRAQAGQGTLEAVFNALTSTGDLDHTADRMMAAVRKGSASQPRSEAELVTA